jgi:hypothetical protein
LIRSRRQSSATDNPLLACRENTCRHVASLRRIRLPCPIARSGCQKHWAPLSSSSGPEQNAAWLPVTVKECTVGLYSPGGGDISIEMLMAVTNREIVAGRMSEDHSQRTIAVEGAAVPHFSHAELIAQHAKLQEATARSSVNAEHMTVGAKLKNLFRRRDHGTHSRKL